MRFLKDKFKPRLYQEKIFSDCVKNNCLVVLPTGLGKTIIALMLSVYSLKKEENKILFLAPTKPLVEQHRKTFKEFFEAGDKDLLVVSGEVSPSERRELYKNARIVFATPQTIENDLLTKSLNLENFTLVIFDECHRGIGDYAYCFISSVYKKQNEKGRVLGLSASPGSNKEKILEVCRNLNLNEVVHMDEKNIEVTPYIKEKEITKIELELPKGLESIKSKLELSLKKRLVLLKRKGLIETIDVNKINKRTFLILQNGLQAKLREDKSPEIFEDISLVAEVVKILYALELLQTQGVKPLISYFETMKKQMRVKANRSLYSDADFREAVKEGFEAEGKVEHPKFEKLKEIILDNLVSNAKFIVFTQYRNTGKRIVEYLKDVKFVKPVLFIGQAGKEGLTQKQQLEVIENFDKGKYNVLVATSVAEEGLHIPSVDYAIFFEPVPSGLRMIQRRGRVGRTKVGKVLVMYTKGCIDEKYLYVSNAKEKKMKYAIEDVKESLNNLKQKRLGDF
ncbi:MAG: DEAD/DEAH box helicase family protein [Nanoarchaeota archaeon]|nr:DEAD/DEAH box helicase family protein [Nanoarchaeota archaeon]